MLTRLLQTDKMLKWTKKKFHIEAKNIRLFPHFRKIKLYFWLFTSKEKKNAYLIGEGTANFATWGAPPHYKRTKIMNNIFNSTILLNIKYIHDT